MPWNSSRREVTERRDMMQELTDRIVAELERGVVPWKRDWDPQQCGGPQAPCNPVTQSRYHGINVLILGMDLRAFQTGDPRWMTYQQAHERGWQVRKGERATTIFFYKPLEVEDDKVEEETRIVPILKHYAVFHASQIDGAPLYRPPTIEEAPWRKPESAEIIIRNSGAVVRPLNRTRHRDSVMHHNTCPEMHREQVQPNDGNTAHEQTVHVCQEGR